MNLPPAHSRGRQRRERRRVHAGTDRALLRHRLRPARPVRQSAADQAAGSPADQDPGARGVRCRREL